MAKEIRCPECESPNPCNLHAEGNVGSRKEGGSIPRSSNEGPKYECRKCRHQFDV